MDCSPPGSSLHGFSRQEYWSGLPFPSPGDLPNSGIEPWPPTFQADALTSEPPGKPTIRMLQFSYFSVGQYYFNVQHTILINLKGWLLISLQQVKIPPYFNKLSISQLCVAFICQWRGWLKRKKRILLQNKILAKTCIVFVSRDLIWSIYPALFVKVALSCLLPRLMVKVDVVFAVPYSGSQPLGSPAD